MTFVTLTGYAAEVVLDTLYINPAAVAYLQPRTSYPTNAVVGTRIALCSGDMVDVKETPEVVLGLFEGRLERCTVCDSTVDSTVGICVLCEAAHASV